MSASAKMKQIEATLKFATTVENLHIRLEERGRFEGKPVVDKDLW